MLWLIFLIDGMDSCEFCDFSECMSIHWHGRVQRNNCEFHKYKSPLRSTVNQIRSSYGWHKRWHLSEEYQNSVHLSHSISFESEQTSDVPVLNWTPIDPVFNLFSFSFYLCWWWIEWALFVHLQKEIIFSSWASSFSSITWSLSAIKIFGWCKRLHMLLFSMNYNNTNDV